MKFFPTRKNNPCPICSDTSGDCRTTESSLILCHDHIDFDPNISGWKWLGTSSNSVWGKFIPDRGKQGDFDRELWQEEKEEQKRKQKEAYKNALGRDERDREIKKILSQLSLSDRDRQMLENRGLTDAQIEQNGYRSVVRWQKLSSPVSNRLAGTNDEGNKLNNPCDGILCPVINADGLFIGIEIA